MAKDSFKIKKSLHLKPTDSSEVDSPEVGDIIVDSSDDNKLKLYADGEFATIAGSGGLVANFFSDFDKLTPTLAQASVADDAVVFLPIDDNKKSKKITFSVADPLSPGSALYEVAASADLEGAQGLMTIWIKTDVQGVTVSTTTDGVKQSTLSVLATGKWRQYEIPYVVGGTNQGLIVESANSGDVNIDEPFVGLAPAGYIQDVGQAHFVGNLTYNAANCVWATTSTTYDSFPIDADCVASNINESVTAPNTKIPGIKITNARTDGYYKVTYDGLLYITNQTGACLFSLSSTGSFDNQPVNYIEGSDRTSNSLNGNFRFSTTGDKEVEIVGYRSGGTGGECAVYGNNLVSGTFAVHFFPDASSTIVAQDAGIEVPIVEEWQSFTPTGTFTNTTYTGHYRRVGDSMELRIRGVLFGTPAATNALQVNLPAGFSIDTTKMNSPAFLDSSFGNAVLSNDGAAFYNSQASVNGNNIYLTLQNNTSGQVVSVTNTVPFAWGAGDRFSVTYKVPIQGWSSTETKDAKVIGKFEQIEEVKADLTAATANELSAKIDGNAVIVSQNYPFISSCSENTSSPFEITCNFENSIFSQPASCTATVTSTASVIQHTAKIISLTENQVVIQRNANDDVASQVLGIELHCSKQGADVNKSFVGAIINASQSAQQIADIVRTDIVSSDLVKVRAAGNNGASLNADGIINFTEIEDQFNAWDGSTFTAPKDGFYQFSGGVDFINNGIVGIKLRVNSNSSTDQFIGFASDLSNVSIIGVVKLNKNDTVNILTSESRILNNVTGIHHLQITELPDTESIVKNLLAESSQTKCQTKVLSANSSSTGIMTGLQFNNLTVGKKYSLSGKFFLDANSNAIFKDAATSTQTFPQLYNSAGLHIQSVGKYIFTANTTTIYPQQLTTSVIYGAAGINNTWVQLCQLPDTVVDTNEW